MPNESTPNTDPTESYPHYDTERKVSPRCLLRTFPTAKPKPLGRRTLANRLPRKPPLTYRQQATRALDSAYAVAVLDANVSSPWAFPTPHALISLLQSAMMGALTIRGNTLGTVAQMLGIRLVSGIFELPLSEHEYVTQTFPLEEQYRIGARRLHISHSMLRTPSGSPVQGRSIGTLAVDSNNEIVRAMLRPVWSEHNAVGLPRSNVERQILHHAWSNGIVVFTPQHKSQYWLWQQSLGNRWKGDLTKIPFIGDFLIPPTDPTHLVGLHEEFGVQRIRTYDDRTTRKLRIGAELELDGAVRFLCHKSRWGSQRDNSILEAVEQLKWAVDDGSGAVRAGLFVPWATEKTV